MIRDTTLPVWFCWVPKLGGDVATGNGGLHRAATASKARYLCYLNARDAGYYSITFADIHVRRERAYDSAKFHDGVMPRYAETR